MNSQYIINNKQQETNVFKQLESFGAKWRTGTNLNEFMPSEGLTFEGFPYSIVLNCEELTVFYTYDVTVDLDAII